MVWVRHPCHSRGVPCPCCPLYWPACPAAIRSGTTSSICFPCWSACRCGSPTGTWPATGGAQPPQPQPAGVPALRLCGLQPGRSVRGGALQRRAGLGRGQQLPAPERPCAAGDRLPLARRRGSGGLRPAAGAAVGPGPGGALRLPRPRAAATGAGSPLPPGGAPVPWTTAGRRDGHAGPAGRGPGRQAAPGQRLRQDGRLPASAGHDATPAPTRVPHPCWPTATSFWRVRAASARRCWSICSRRSSKDCRRTTTSTPKARPRTWTACPQDGPVHLGCGRVWKRKICMAAMAGTP